LPDFSLKGQSVEQLINRTMSLLRKLELRLCFSIWLENPTTEQE